MAVRLLSNQNVNGDIDVNHSQNAITYVAVTNTNTGVAANSRVQVAGESSQLDLIATSAGYTGVTGWADAGIITTDSGASGGLKLNSQAGGIQLQIGTTSHFYLATTGNVGINDAGAAATSLSVKDTQDTAFTSGISVIRSANSDVGYINMVGGAFNLNSTKNTKLRVSDVTKLEIKSNGINVIGKTETDTLLSTGAAQFDTTAQIGSDLTATPELLTVQAYSHNEAFSGKSSATNYIWFLRNENDSGRFQLFNSSGDETIEFTGADGAATFTGTVDIHATTGDSLLQFNIDGDTYSMGIDNSDSDKFKLSYGVFGNTDLISIAPNGYTIFTGSIIGNNGITLGGSNKTLETLYNNTTSYRGALGWSYLQMGNNGSNDIIGGNTAAGGTLRFFTNNTNFCGADVAPNGNLALTLAADKSATFTGDVEFDKNVWQDISTNGGYIMRPNGADYVTTTGAVTGAIEIRIPTGGAGKDDMIKFVVDIYDYATQESITVFIGGYIYQAIGGTTWTNVSAQIIATDSSKNYKVRFGDNGSVHCVWIGETDSTWSYPQILVRDFYGGFATTVEDYLATWDITYVTSITTVSNTLTNNFPMSHGGTDDAFWSANGNDIYNDNTANVGIGTTSPSSKIDVREDANNVYTGYFYNSSTAANAHGINVQTATTNAGAYAFRVNSGSNSNALVVKGDANVGIGTTSPIQKLDTPNIVIGGSTIAGTYRANALFMDNNGGNSRFYSSGADASTKGSYEFNIMASDANPLETPLVIANTGNVGIGTTTPAVNLQVEAAGPPTIAQSSSISITSGTRGDLAWYNSSVSTVANIRADVDTSATADNVGTDLTFFTRAIGGSLTQKMVIKGGGNVGIGTASPTLSKLVISGGTTGSVGGGDAGITMINKFDNPDNSWSILPVITGVSNTGFSVRDNTDSADRLVIDGSGNVGIGTTTPDAKLHIYGSASLSEMYLGEDAAADKAGILKYTQGDGNGTGVITLSHWGNTSTTQSLAIKYGGNVGIGTTSPGAKLEVTTSTAGFASIIQNTNSASDANGLLIKAGTVSSEYSLKVSNSTDSTNFMVVKGNGNVGIGTTAPANTLHVQSSSNLVTRFTGGSTFSLIQNNTDSTVIFSANHGNASPVGVEKRFIWQMAGGTAKMKLDDGTLTVSADLIAYGSPSDKRLKENIKPINSALEKVTKLQGVTFDWKDKKQDKAYDPDQRWKEDIGFIAQDVKEVVPELVRENNNGMLSMRHQGVIPILVEAIKELKAEIEELKKNK